MIERTVITEQGDCGSNLHLEFGIGVTGYNVGWHNCGVELLAEKGDGSDAGWKNNEQRNHAVIHATLFAAACRYVAEAYGR